MSKRSSSMRKDWITQLSAVLLPMIMVMLLLTQRASAQNTYVITDGDRVFTYTTSETDPRSVLGEAGLELDDDDTYTTMAGNGTSEITIHRSQNIHINYRGEEMDVISHGETVEQLLNRLNLPMEAGDTVSCAMTEQTYDGMRLRIEKVICQNQTYTSNIPHGVQYYYDPSLPEGMEEVIVPGVDGELLCTDAVTYVNSRETARTVLSQSVLRSAVDEMIAVGTGLNTAPASDADMPIITEDKIILPNGEVLSYTGSATGKATAYCLRGRTATGTTAQEGVVAVDPKFIPFGTRMFIISDDGQYVYGIATAEDAGDSNIVGNRIDLWFPTQWDCIQFGFRSCTIYFLGSD